MLDASDPFMSSTVTASGGAYLFDKLPDGDYIVVVDTSDAQIPTGYRITTDEQIWVENLASAYTLADFGFGPSLSVTKSLVGDATEGDDSVQYSITVQNLRPGGGEGDANTCTYTVWASELDAAKSGSIIAI